MGALKWRMRSITPFSFIPFFISLFKLQDPPLWQALKARAVEIIFKAQNGKCPDKNSHQIQNPIKHIYIYLYLNFPCISEQFTCFADINFLVYKPSIVSASALLSASHELFPLQFPCFRKALSNCSYINKVNTILTFYLSFL